MWPKHRQGRDTRPEDKGLRQNLRRRIPGFRIAGLLCPLQLCARRLHQAGALVPFCPVRRPSGHLSNRCSIPRKLLVLNAYIDGNLRSENAILPLCISGSRVASVRHLANPPKDNHSSSDARLSTSLSQKKICLSYSSEFSTTCMFRSFLKAAAF
jgi:hypothetical protein